MKILTISKLLVDIHRYLLVINWTLKFLFFEFACYGSYIRDFKSHTLAKILFMSALNCGQLPTGIGLDFLVRPADAFRIFGVSHSYLEKRRYSGELIEGVHYIKLSHRLIRYNKSMIWDWLRTQNDPVAHKRTIQHFQAALPSNQPLPKGRKVLGAGICHKKV